MPDNDESLGDQHTFDGVAKDTGPQSLGDEHTFGGTDPDGQAPFDDGMEVVDLSARYTIEGVLGKGGMGEVLLATDTRLGRKVAIKRMLGDAAHSRTAVSRFLTEAKSIAALNHPNIVQIYDYGRASDGPFLIMEFVKGSSLLDKCREGAIPLDEAIELTCQLCDGLGKAHEANIIHRDIKPANILLTNDGVPKLTDFGLAKDETTDSGLSVAGAVLGTLDFMPPEQRKDAALTDARSDLWSLAATLYQMVSGEPPRVIDLDEVPQEIRSCLAQALKQKQDDRYQNAREFRDALRAAQQGVGSEELEEGSCPNCGTKNPTSRKFCRDCATSLEAECLSCSAVLPMWEKVCDSCGAKQGDLLDERRESMASSQSEAESLLKVYDFDRAKALAMALRDEPDLRLQHLKGWAEKFLPQIDQGRQRQLEQIGGQLKEAAAHEQAHDYAAGLRVLEKVPEILRETEVSGDTVSGVMARLQSTLDEIKRLDTEIRQRVKTRKVNGLLSEVNQLLELQPDRKDISKLKTQLLEREEKLKETRDEAYAAAQQKLSAQDYEGVLEEIARIDESMLCDEITQLRDEAIEKRDRLKSLRAAISEGVKTKQLHGLLKKVDECLSLQSGDAELEKLREKLQAREEKNAVQVANVIEKAQSLREECRFAAASNGLRRIPQMQMTQEASDLLEDCDALGALREMAMRSLKSAMDSEEYKSGLAQTKEYSDSLEGGYLEDEEFSRVLAACQRALEEQREAEQAAERRGALTIKLNLAAAALIVTLVIVLAVWPDSSPAPSNANTDQPAGSEVGTQTPPAAIAPFDAVQATTHQTTWPDQLGVPVETTNSIGAVSSTSPLSIPDSPATNPIAAVEQAPWIDLLAGSLQSQWRGSIGTPKEQAGMPSSRRRVAQQQADSMVRKHWRLSGGVLSYDGYPGGPNLSTTRKFRDFELSLEWKIAEGGDSGIYLRGLPQVQIWDPNSNITELALHGSGGLYNNQTHSNVPTVRADRPVGQWNTMSIWLIDDKASVELNGRQVVDSIVMENFEDRSQPLYPEGPIELQKFSGPLSFRNIRVRELFLPLSRNTEGNSSTNQDKMPSLHMLPELVAESTASIAISSDGKTVFWDRNGVIWSAERDDLSEGSTFRNGQEWIEGRHLTISGDMGVLLIKQPNRDSETLHQFTLTDGKPSRPMEISTLVPDSGRVFSPHLSSNGDVLSFAGRITGPLPQLFVSKRSTIPGLWTIALPLLRDSQLTDGWTGPWLSDDGKVLLTTNQGQSVRDDESRYPHNMFVARRTSVNQPFTRAELIDLPGMKSLWFQSPRYLPETDELFVLVQPRSEAGTPTWKPAVIRGVRLDER